MQRNTFVRHRLQNWVHTVVLLGAMAAILGTTGWMVAGVTGLVAAVGFGVVSMVFSTRFSPEIILRLYDARPVDPREAPGLHNIVEALADRADLPDAPDLYYVPSRMMNAMTVGSRSDPAVAVTDGLLRGLAPDELAGVVAHEIAHIANGDTRVMGFADLLARLTNTMSTFGKLLLFLNLPLLLSGSVPVPWGLVAVLLVAPVVSELLQLALSRTREFDADANAARLTGEPAALARGLDKLETYNESLVKRLVLPGYGRRQPSVLRTHPHTDERIRRLRELADDVDADGLDPDGVDIHHSVDRVDRDPRWRPLGTWY